LTPKAADPMTDTMTAAAGAPPATPHGAPRRARQVARRGDVARAAFAVIARDGLDGASLRAIAGEMGCSTGVLTHHFRDKSELIGFILDTLLEAIVGQLGNAAAMTGPDPLPRLLLALLPNDPASELRWRVAAAFTAAAINEPRLRHDQERREAIIHDWFVTLLIGLRDRGAVPRDIDPVVEAELLYCFIDGLAMHTLLLPSRYTRRRQKTLVDVYVANLTRRRFE